MTKKEIEKIIILRQTGHSLPEICKNLGRGGSTVYKYAKDVKISPECKEILNQKRGGSKKRAIQKWESAYHEAKLLLKKINRRDKLFILASLYWGEGTKSELDIINSDPYLIKTYVMCLQEIGIKKSDLRVSLRLYENIDVAEAKRFWAGNCNINIENIININVLKGKKNGKLPFGMCRVRVKQGGKAFKLIISMIKFIKSEIQRSYSSTDRTRDS